MEERKERDRSGGGAAATEARRAATLRLIERHGAHVMRTARRYAATPEDAEDAYQRAVEIMLTKAPEIPESELLPWLKTVVRHEAFALRRKNERVALGPLDSFDGEGVGEDGVPSLRPTPVEQAERFERLRLGAEALRGLKPQEARALALLAQGYSYHQICEKTGWSYTKVNRCLAEGRQAFVRRVAGIESGVECERLAPKLSAFADGEAPPADVALLRRHLRGCLACRASLREHYLAPAAVGALLSATLGESMVHGIERATHLVSELKVKLVSLVRVPSYESASGFEQIAVCGGSRGLTASGLAKGLAVLCVGGAGAGGIATYVDPMLEAPEPRAAPQSGGERAPSLEPSPARRLVAERFRGATAKLGSGPKPDDDRSSASDASSRAGARGLSSPTKTYAAARGEGGAAGTPSYGGQRTAARDPSPDRGSGSSTTPSGDTEYGSGAPDPPDSYYGSGAPEPPDSYYGSGAPDPPDSYYGAGTPDPPESRYGSGTPDPPEEPRP